MPKVGSRRAIALRCLGVYAILPLTEAHTRQIADWRYPAPYEFYDRAADPDDLSELLDAQRWSPDSHFGGWIGSPPGDQMAGFYTFERHRREWSR